MLVLSRKVGERIQIGERITLVVSHITPTGVQLAIEAPPDMTIVRGELLARLAALEAGDAPQDCVALEDAALP